MSKDDKTEDSGIKSIEGKDLESTFYEYLRDAQPLAFLASFSIVIAVFAFPNQKFNSVFEFAASASAMFLISFVVSLIGRMAHYRETIEKSFGTTYTELTRYGTFFFFGMGVFYLILILLEFSKTLSSISLIASGWLPLLGGFGILVWGRKKIVNELKGSIIEKILSISMIGLTATLFIHGSRVMIKALMKTDIVPANYFVPIYYAEFAFLAIIIVTIGILNKKSTGAFTTNRKEGTTEKIANVSVLIFSIILGISIFTSGSMQTDCDMSCKSKFENLGFLCEAEKENQFLCRFVADKATTITLPLDASILPNEKNFQPDETIVNLEVNNVIRWTNLDKNTHKITSNAFGSKDIETNNSFTYRFAKEGIYEYHGDLPWLRGKIVVKNLDNEYQSGAPLEQITNKNNVFYKIFRESDHSGYIRNSSISSSDSMLVNLTNQTEPKFLKIGDMIIADCLKNGENSTVSYLTLTEINDRSTPYALFKEVRKSETKTCSS